MNMIQYLQTNGIDKGMQVSKSDGKVLEEANSNICILTINKKLVEKNCYHHRSFWPYADYNSTYNNMPQLTRTEMFIVNNYPVNSFENRIVKWLPCERCQQGLHT